MGDVVSVAFRPAHKIEAIGEMVNGTCMLDRYDTYPSFYKSCDFVNSTKEAGRLFQEDETPDGHFRWRAERLRDVFSSEEDLMSCLLGHAHEYAGIRQLLTIEDQTIKRIAHQHHLAHQGVLTLRRVIALKCSIAEGSYKFPTIVRRDEGMKSLALVSAQILFQLPDTYFIRIIP